MQYQHASIPAAYDHPNMTQTQHFGDSMPTRLLWSAKPKACPSKQEVIQILKKLFLSFLITSAFSLDMVKQI